MKKELEYIIVGFLLLFAIFTVCNSEAKSYENKEKVETIALFQRQLTVTKANLDKAESLLADGIISKKEYNDLKGKFDQAQENYKIAIATPPKSLLEKKKEYDLIKKDPRKLKAHLTDLRSEYNKLIQLYYKGLVSEDELINVEIQYKASLLKLELVQRQANLKLKAPLLINPVGFVVNKAGLYVSSPWGNRKHPVSGSYAFHSGVDIAAPWGTPVYAYDNGYVLMSTYGAFAGKYVEIAHGKSYSTLYLHLSKYVVNPKQYVRKGQIIGYVGSTGRSTGPHLHFELRKNGVSQNINSLVFHKLSAINIEESEKM